MRSLNESLHFAQPATSTVTNDVDVERNIGSVASATVAKDDSESPFDSLRSPREAMNGRLGGNAV